MTEVGLRLSGPVKINTKTSSGKVISLLPTLLPVYQCNMQELLVKHFKIHRFENLFITLQHSLMSFCHNNHRESRSLSQIMPLPLCRSFLNVLNFFFIVFHSRLILSRYLLEAGADPFVSDSDGNIALHWAVLSGSMNAVELLLNHGCDVNAANNIGDTPL